MLRYLAQPIKHLVSCLAGRAIDIRGTRLDPGGPVVLYLDDVKISKVNRELAVEVAEAKVLNCSSAFTPTAMRPGKWSRPGRPTRTAGRHLGPFAHSPQQLSLKERSRLAALRRGEEGI